MSVGIDAKVALILGGAGGIGSAAARDLAAHDARVAGVALRKSSDPALDPQIQRWSYWRAAIAVAKGNFHVL